MFGLVRAGQSLGDIGFELLWLSGIFLLWLAVKSLIFNEIFLQRFPIFRLFLTAWTVWRKSEKAKSGFFTFKSLKLKTTVGQFLLLCSSFNIQRRDLLAGVSVHYDHLLKSTVFLTMFLYNFCYMVIKAFQIT